MAAEIQCFLAHLHIGCGHMQTRWLEEQPVQTHDFDAFIPHFLSPGVSFFHVHAARIVREGEWRDFQARVSAVPREFRGIRQGDGTKGLIANGKLHASIVGKMNKNARLFFS